MVSEEKQGGRGEWLFNYYSIDDNTYDHDYNHDDTYDDAEGDSWIRVFMYYSTYLCITYSNRFLRMSVKM